VDATSDSIRNYIVGLGEVQGVSGSMAAISETLSGKVSNLKDSWDSYLNVLGSKSGSIFSWVITQMGSLVNMMNIATKTQAEMRKQAQSDILKKAVKRDIEEINALAEKYKTMGLDNPDDRAKTAILEQYKKILFNIEQASEMTNDEIQKEKLKTEAETMQLQIQGINDYYEEQKMLALKAEASKEAAAVKSAAVAADAAKSFFEYRKSLGVTTWQEEMEEELRLFKENEQSKLLSAAEYAEAVQKIKDSKNPYLNIKSIDVDKQNKDRLKKQQEDEEAIKKANYFYNK